eukprot:CAMPEP_0175055666 /NCGR_PEP_ID=MMETSP0052_2-20121109/10215_1 /TAXON_ID=51329 ORGANISM="Polytomella parva, Strain SAG 63-3" /NCGR_SAMPLE_ID=MMETSP0052_2 /ASSEMBLY_ACC=CAM_ASM_000194 /LENGTH=196 /DNA_ID=CAMNT_0016320553 /DNA_START=224 /DNA_END=814 /DNA_ORIENTATION=-
MEKEKISKHKKVQEIDIIETLEKSCNPDLDEGDWISKYDLVEKGRNLRLVNTQKHGSCKTECRTIEAACQELADDFDPSDLSVKLIRGNRNLKSITNWICKEETAACAVPAPFMPKNRPKGEEHEPLDDEAREAHQTLRNLKAQGMNGQLYSRDNLANELDEIQEHYEDDEDFDFLKQELDALREKAKKGATQNEL